MPCSSGSEGRLFRVKDTRQESLERVEPRYTRDDPESIRSFQAMILSHYARSGRDLIWRKTTNPYHILVSEIMLQQTRVERVAVKYPEFLGLFPDFPSLARAPLSQVLSAWQGMGYNRRAIALQKCAIRVVSEFGGILPADVDTLATFPGIGRATASSICAFAFNMPVIFIETNIRRVFIHFFFSDLDTVTDTDILPLVDRSLFREDPRKWYNALMDLGTDLKTKVPNPNRRSTHYTKQPAFEGSDRKIRGHILRTLLTEKKMTENAIITTLSEDSSRVIRILADLENEGFIVRSGSFFTIVS
jgi:A/G-specific adenine glycosylase